MDKPTVLQVGALPQDTVALLRYHFTLTNDAGPVVRALATTGKASVNPELLDKLPGLEIVSCLGAGTDGLDMGELARRGIRVETTAKVLAADVADIAIGLVVALARDFRRADRYVREGRWTGGRYPLGYALAGARLGILGLGTIGDAIASRAVAFGMEIGYHNRRPKPEAAARYFGTLEQLAEWSAFLVVSCPAAPDTEHLVDEPILRALGREGWLVNVSRGSVVNESALVVALETCTIAGAGLDVFADEPHPHPGLLQRENTILLPHIGSATTATREAMSRAMVHALTSALHRP